MFGLTQTGSLLCTGHLENPQTPPSPTPEGAQGTQTIWELFLFPQSTALPVGELWVSRDPTAPRGAAPTPQPRCRAACCCRERGAGPFPAYQRSRNVIYRAGESSERAERLQAGSSPCMAVAGVTQQDAAQTEPRAGTLGEGGTGVPRRALSCQPGSGGTTAPFGGQHCSSASPGSARLCTNLGGRRWDVSSSTGMQQGEGRLPSLRAG